MAKKEVVIMEEIFKIILVCLLFAAVFEIVSPHDDTKSVKKIQLIQNVIMMLMEMNFVLISM